MFEKILKLLVTVINQRLREAKTALETEEKTREIAVLQGRICGWRKLIGYLVELFNLTDDDIYDYGEPAPIIDGMDTTELEKLYAEEELLIASEVWKDLLKRVADNKEFLKENLITEADNARDLYLAQSQHAGLTIYASLFDTLDEEFNRRKEELNFGGGDIPGELPIE